jgi:hypothetical protein
MQVMKKFLFLIFIFFIGTNVFAQQNIISVPSSSVLPGGEIILKQSSKMSPFGNEYASLSPQIIVGTGKDTEVSLNVGTTISDRTSVKMNIGAKKVFKIKQSTRFTVGGILTPSLTEGKKPDSMIYAHTSYMIRKTKTTITAGGFVGGKSEMPSLTGAMLGIDQTIIPNKFRVVADYISRDESWGAFSAGFKIRPEPSTSITTAVIIPNSNDSRVAFSLSVSKYLGKVIPDIPKKKPKDNL